MSLTKKDKKDISVWDGIRIIIVVTTAFAIPTVPITYLLTKFIGVNVFLSIFIGLIISVVIIKILGWDRPAYENQNKGDDEDDD